MNSFKELIFASVRFEGFCNLGFLMEEVALLIQLTSKCINMGDRIVHFVDLANV